MDGEKYGWYSPQNLKRLWRGLRDGERMTCHLTDSRQPQRNGKTVSEGTQTEADVQYAPLAEEAGS